MYKESTSQAIQKDIGSQFFWLDCSLRREEWDSAYNHAQSLICETEVVRAIESGIGETGWSHMLSHPILRVARSGGLDKGEWMRLFRDCLEHEDRVGLVNLMVSRTPKYAAQIGQSREVVARLLKDSHKEIREVGIRCMTGAGGEGTTDGVVPIEKMVSSVSAWRQQVQCMLRRIRRLPDPRKDIRVGTPPQQRPHI